MNIHDYAESRKLNLRQIMDFTSDVNPIGPSSKAKHAIRKGAKDLIFPPDEKLRYLRRYICKKEQVGEENILFGQGLRGFERSVSGEKGFSDRFPAEHVAEVGRGDSKLLGINADAWPLSL